jgi:hypothetical protein
MPGDIFSGQQAVAEGACGCMAFAINWLNQKIISRKTSAKSHVKPPEQPVFL